MPAGTTYPTWAYLQVSPFTSQLVQNAAALTALGASWSTTPAASAGVIPPFDPGFLDTDTRLQQMLIEQRITNQLLAWGLNITDDPQTQLRPEILANDSNLGS